MARQFELVETSVRRHRSNHLLPLVGRDGVSETPSYAEEVRDPGAPEIGPNGPTAIEKEEEDVPETVEATARRRYEEEESRARQERIEALEAEEQGRREREAADRRREEAMAAAREKAAELGVRRRELEERAEAELEAVIRTLDELAGVDKEHVRELDAAKLLSPTTPPLRRTLPRWVSAKMGAYSPGATIDAHGGASLAERDPLTPAKPAGA